MNSEPMNHGSSYPGQNPNQGGWQNQPQQPGPGGWQNQPQQPGPDGWQNQPQQPGPGGWQGQPQQGQPQFGQGQPQQGHGQPRNNQPSGPGRGVPPQQPGFPRLAIRQKISLTVNRYEIYVLDDNGNEGQFLAVAQQKRMALKELVTFYSDDQRSQELFSFRARKRMDLAATYDVVDAQGAPLGYFRKDFGKSFTRSTWHLAEPGGVEITGQERSAALAILRRLFGDNVPFLDTMYNFDFTTGAGEKVMQHSRILGMRNRYAVELPVFDGRRLDWRLAAAMGVALDALQAR